MSGKLDNTISQQTRQGLLNQDVAHIGSWAIESTDIHETQGVSSLGRAFNDVSKPPRAPMAKDTQQAEDAKKTSYQYYGLLRWQIESVNESPWTAAQVTLSQVQDKDQ